MALLRSMGRNAGECLALGHPTSFRIFVTGRGTSCDAQAFQLGFLLTCESLLLEAPVAFPRLGPFSCLDEEIVQRM